MINKRSEINYEKIISQLKIGDHIPDENDFCTWIIDEIYGKYNKYCKCHLRYVGGYIDDNGEIIDASDSKDYYDDVKIFKYCDIAKAIKDSDDRTFDLETAFREVLDIE